LAKGSDKWGQGSGPKVEVVLAALVIVSLVGVAFFYLEGRGLTSGAQQGKVTMVSTTGVGCNDNSLPQIAQQVEQDPAFTSLSNGLCYNYLGEAPSENITGGFTLSFAYYSGTITYPCGDAPLEIPTSQIQVAVTSAQKVASAEVLSPGEVSSQTESCDPSIPVKVVSVADVESTIPAVPQLNVTLAAQEGRTVTSLKAVLTLGGGSQTFLFGGVTSTSPLASPRSVSSTMIILSSLSFSASEVYPMSISGAFDNGQTFSYLVHVQVAQVP
jgi:hypothetical protein